MTTLRDLLNTCDEVVRSHLELDEDVIAVGRCEDITIDGGVEKGGAAWTYVMVTNKRLRWVPHARPRLEASLDFDNVTAASETTLHHRYAITLSHTRLARPWELPSRPSFLPPPERMVVTRYFGSTSLAFSRRDTVAARVTRQQLNSRGVL